MWVVQMNLNINKYYYLYSFYKKWFLILVPLRTNKTLWNGDLFWFYNSYVNWIFLCNKFKRT